MKRITIALITVCIAANSVQGKPYSPLEEFTKRGFLWGNSSIIHKATTGYIEPASYADMVNLIIDKVSAPVVYREGTLYSDLRKVIDKRVQNIIEYQWGGFKSESLQERLRKEATVTFACYTAAGFHLGEMATIFSECYRPPPTFSKEDAELVFDKYFSCCNCDEYRTCLWNRILGLATDYSPDPNNVGGKSLSEVEWDITKELAMRYEEYYKFCKENLLD